MRIAILLLLVSGLLGSCQRCYDDPPGPPPVTLYFVDSLGNNLVNDRGDSFHPDSIQARIGTEIIYLEKFYDQPTDGYKFRTYPGVTDARLNKAIVYLDVSSSDTDTLDVYSISHTGKCFNTIEYTDVFFNGNKVEKNLQTFEFAFVKKIK